MVSTKDRIEFAVLFCRHTKVAPFSDLAISHDIAQLLRLAATHQHIAEYHCNGNCPHRHERFKDVCTKQLRIETKIRALLSKYARHPEFGGDPRGCTVKIVCPDGFSDDMGQEGICVPA